MKIKELKQKLNINIKNKNLLIQALTHKSYDSKNNYEKLEFLGDRVLGIVISDKLLEMYPNEKVGILDKKLASLVNKNKCFEVGKKLELQRFVMVGKSKYINFEIEDKIISDCCEAIIGFIYKEFGLDDARKFILDNWKNLLDKSDVTIIDSKTQLQEYSLKKFKSLPIYKVISNTGPRHKPEFKVGVKIKNHEYVVSKGYSKKNAEQSAANLLLKKLKKQ